jgi:hypothetical protein
MPRLSLTLTIAGYLHIATNTRSPHTPAQLNQPSLTLALFHLEPMTAHMLAASLPARRHQDQGMPACEPFPSIHAPRLLQSLSSVKPTTGPIRRPQCSSFAKDLDCWAVGSLQVAKPCCHRSTARHHLVANAYQTGVCQSATPRPNMTQRQQYIHTIHTYSKK